MEQHDLTSFKKISLGTVLGCGAQGSEVGGPVRRPLLEFK